MIMKLTFEMLDEQVDEIIVQELKNTIETLEQNIEDRTGENAIWVFDSDPIKDISTINEYISAFKLVLDWYGGDL